MPEAASRSELSIILGRCPDDEVDALMVAIAELPECKRAGGVVSARAYFEGVSPQDRPASQEHPGSGPVGTDMPRAVGRPSPLDAPYPPGSVGARMWDGLRRFVEKRK